MHMSDFIFGGVEKNEKRRRDEKARRSGKVNSLVVQKPSEWAKEQRIVIIDPDGWRGKDGRDFEDPISEAEFERRKMISTIMHNSQITNRRLGASHS
jgi:hypothetical protein